MKRFRRVVATAARCISVVLVLAVTSVAPASEHRRAIEVQPARAVLTTTTASAAVDAIVAVDLRNVWTGDHPAILGGYVASIAYDATKVAFIKATAADDPAFKEAPFATDAKIANANGIVRIAAAQTNPNAPAGLVRVAHLQFRELVPGGAKSLRARVLSAAAPVENGSAASLKVEGE